MPSLSEAYQRQTAEVSRSRFFAGVGLFTVGALLVIAGILTGTTTIALEAGLSVFGARELAGVLAGLGLPAVLVGVTMVLPATATHRAMTAIGAALTVVGVGLFRFTYPDRWYIGGSEGIPTTFTLGTTLVYFSGAVLTFWTVFTALATFKRRNDPGGTVSVPVSRGGETTTVDVAAEDAATARDALATANDSGGPVREDFETVPTQTGSGDASGQQTTTVQEDDADVIQPVSVQGEAADRYCGNCASFDYVQTSEGIQPYCGYHDELMDDMDACSHWTPTAADDSLPR